MKITYIFHAHSEYMDSCHGEKQKVSKPFNKRQHKTMYVVQDCQAEEVLRNPGREL